MAEPQDIRRKRLLFRSQHRGTKECDLLLGSFANAHLAAMTEQQLDSYEALLDVPDAELFAWLGGRAAEPEGCGRDVLELLKNFKFRQSTL
ncbi:MAG: succinate dehydrogenase assembly factor 2 [Alphaproteobacteria bacterium]|nr:succinate dehydrogenase assembly factor 2 [Alphaproteobacteria bacterium]